MSFGVWFELFSCKRGVGFFGYVGYFGGYLNSCSIEVVLGIF